MKVIILSTILIFISAGCIQAEFCEGDSVRKAKFQILQLQSHEDNLLGYTFDSDDDPFVDLTLSFRTRIFPFDYMMNLLPKTYRQDLHLNFAFTGRFGQYVGTRHSNPVVEKRFNPFLFFEYRPKTKLKNLQFQFGYGHESNGQAIDDSITFYKTASLKNNDIKETRDKISRGWDYYGISLTADFFPKKHPTVIYEVEWGFRYFLQRGFLQDGKEEYSSWERDWSGENFTRNNVSGVAIAFSCFIDSSFINKFSITYETGISRPFQANTLKAKIGFKIGNFPLSITYRYGYTGDLAQFGKCNSTFGIESLFPSFGRPDDKSGK